jgi:branched-chain amino acid transport system substrate-binding protein
MTGQFSSFHNPPSTPPPRGAAEKQTDEVIAMRLLLVAVVTFGLVLSLAGMAQAAEPIKIGVFISVTGPASYFGDPEAKTFQLEVERINREGGIMGRPIKMVLYDDGSDPKQAVSFARKLIEQDKVDVLFGGSVTGTTMAVIPVVQEAEIPLISIAGGTPIAQPVKKWVFKIPHTGSMATQKDLLDMQKRKLTKIAVIGGSVGFDASCRQEVHEIAPKLGMTVVADETWAQTDTDMTPQLTRIREKNPQAIMNCGTQSPAVISVRNYQSLGMSKIPLYFNHGVAAQDFLEAAGSAVEGMRLPVAAVLVAAQLPDKDPQKKISLEYEKNYVAAYKKPIAYFGSLAHDALVVYSAAVKKAGTTDKAKVRDALEGLKNVVGTNGIFNMSPSDHVGLAIEELHMAEVRNGKWKLLY